MTKFFQSRLFLLLLGVLLIAIGIPYAMRSARGVADAYRAGEFAARHNFDAGNPDVELVSHWMNIRYIAEAYTVPQSYIFDELGIEMNRPNSEIPLGRLNKRFRFGDSPDGGPTLVESMREVILSYRENPVVTGLSEGRVRRWMNVTYIANSTGIPVEDFFDALGLPVDGYAHMPLSRLAAESNYEPGPERLEEILQGVVDAHGEGK